MADIDEDATADEIEVVIQKMREWTIEDEIEASTILRASFEWYAWARTEGKIGDQINANQDLLTGLSDTQKETLFSDLRDIAEVDGKINEAEQNLMDAIKNLLTD